MRTLSKHKLRKVKTKTVKLNEDTKTELRWAMNGGEYAKAAEIGLKLYKTHKENTPPLVFHVLGEAFFHIADEMKVDKTNTNAVKRQQSAYGEAWHWLKKAYDAGLLVTPEQIIKILSTAEQLRKPPHNQFIYTVAKETLQKINEGKFGEVHKTIIDYLYVQIANSAKSVGQFIDNINALQYCLKHSETIEDKTRNFSNILYFSHFLDYTAEDLFDLSKVYNSLFKNVVPYTHDLSQITKEIAESLHSSFCGILQGLRRELGPRSGHMLSNGPESTKYMST